MGTASRLCGMWGYVNEVTHKRFQRFKRIRTPFDTVMSHFWQIIRLKWPLINYFCSALAVISSSYDSHIGAASASLWLRQVLKNLIGLKKINKKNHFFPKWIKAKRVAKDKLKKEDLKRMSKRWLSPAVISPGIRRHKVSPVIFTVICLLLKLATQRAEQLCHASTTECRSTVGAAVCCAVFESAASLGFEPSLNRPPSDGTGGNFTFYILQQLWHL